MISEYDKFMSLDALIRKNPTDELTLKDIYSFTKTNIDEAKKVIRALGEKYLQDTSNRQCFIFHPEVLGMDECYLLQGRHPFDTSRPTTKISFKKDSVYSTITLPDHSIMEHLKFKLTTSEFRRLEKFYNIFKDLANTQKYNEGYLEFINSSGDDVGIHNLMSEKLPIYIGNTKLQYKSNVLLQDGDIIKIGDSIIFGYFKFGNLKKEPKGILNKLIQTLLNF